MNDALWGTIVASGLAIAFVHAVLPTHWLPFVLAGRGQGWSNARTMTVTALAGGGHVLFTIVLGVLVEWLGFSVDAWIGSRFPWIAGSALILFGLYYWFRDRHSHRHFGVDADMHDHDHQHPHPHAPRLAVDKGPAPRSDFAVVLGLVTVLTFSPCEGFLPIFVAGVRYGWFGFAVLCLILAVATLAGMLLLTALTLRGMQYFKLESLARHEGRILGGMLIVLGGVVAMLGI